MNPHEEQKIIQWSKGLSGDVHLVLNTTEDERSEEIHLFCRELSTFASNIKFEKRHEKENNKPSIQISDNLSYCGVPVGSELDPFLEAIGYEDDGFAFLPIAIREKVQTIETPVSLKLYVTQMCPNCPSSVRSLVPLTVVSKAVSLEIIDAMLFPELARADDVQGVPTVVLDNGFCWTGEVSLGEIAEVMTNSDPSCFSVSTIERMLLEGKASAVADMILENGEVFPVLVDLLIDDKFTTRLGAMAVIEEVTEKDIDLAYGIIQPLWQRFDNVIEPMQIDLLYLIGEAGTRETIPILQTVIDGHYRDHVKEIAIESIESIEMRNPVER